MRLPCLCIGSRGKKYSFNRANGHSSILFYSLSCVEQDWLSVGFIGDNNYIFSFAGASGNHEIFYGTLYLHVFFVFHGYL